LQGEALRVDAALSETAGNKPQARPRRTVPIVRQFDETFDVGPDTGTPVDDQDYQVPFKFTGKLNKLTLTTDRPQLTPEDETRLMMEGQRNNRMSE
jgi:hypothetical protein